MKRKKENKIEIALHRAVEAIYPSKKDLLKTLKKRKIKIYQGFDPSMPNLHLGNLVGILKLRDFQKLGHEVIFLIGDFTGMIGDPTDKLATRRKLSREEVLSNVKNWYEQIKRFLDFSGKNPVKITFNSRWLDKITFKDLIEITSNFTVQRMIERDFFQERLKLQRPIFLHEFLYPIAQALDSVNLNIDLEIGGTDQLFNMLVGRDLIKVLKNKEKFVMTTKLLVDKEGKKIGKTTSGAIFLNLSPFEMFGTIMSFPDETIILAMELLTRIPLNFVREYERTLEKQKINPKEIKKILAYEVVKMNYGISEAKKSQREFEIIFEEKLQPRVISLINVSQKTIDLISLLIQTGFIKSKSEAKRLILEGAIDINGKVERDWRKIINLEKEIILKVGKKKFFKIKSK